MLYFLLSFAVCYNHIRCISSATQQSVLSFLLFSNSMLFTTHTKFHRHSQSYSSKAASQPIISPLRNTFHLQEYDYSLDLWSFGCMFASMVSRHIMH